MKTAIVGAGICGLYLAWKLSERGNDVTVFEKRQKIGKEACSGLFSDRIMDFFPEIRKLIENEIGCVFVHFPKKNLKIKFSRNFFVINHALLDNFAAEKAMSAGAKILLGRNVEDFPEGFERIIGCDGAISFIRRKLGLRDPKLRLGILGFEDTPPGAQNKSEFSDSADIWPTKGGFLWRIPHREKIEFGIIEDPIQAPPVFKEFLKKRGINIKDVKAAAIPSEWRRFLIPGNPAATLCGDAAAIVKPWSGGGVVWGLLTADILLKNFPDFLKYHRVAKMIFYPRILLGAAAMKIIYFLGFHFPWLLPQEVKIEGDFLK